MLKDKFNTEKRPEMSDEIELNACPFCREFKALSIDSKGDDPCGQFYVVCYLCGARGPLSHAKEDSAKEWNSIRFWNSVKVNGKD
jgi:hypothetical protein